MENRHLSKYAATLLLLALILARFEMLPYAYSEVPTVQDTAGWSAQDETLSVAKYLYELDMTKYNPQLISDTFPPTFGLPATEDVLFTLGNVSDLHRDVDFSCSFTNQKLTLAMFSVYNGAPFYIEPQPTNPIDATKAFLDRYQKYSGASYVQAMRDMLNNINSTQNTIITPGGIKLTVTTIAPGWVSFRFDKIINGLETQEWLEVDFENYYLSTFVDKWNTFTVGSTDINVSKDEAMRIAREYLKTYSWNVSQGNGGLVEVKDFTVLETPVDVSMWMYPRQDPLTVYPHWNVVLYLDKVYAGGVSRIEVGVWADTGEIVYCTPLSYGGTVPSFTPPPSPPTTKPFPTAPVAAASIALVAVATAGLLIYFRKRKRQALVASSANL